MVSKKDQILIGYAKTGTGVEKIAFENTAE